MTQSPPRATALQLLETVELWPLEWWAVNGHAVLETAELFRTLGRKLRDEPDEPSSVLRQITDAA